MLHALCLAVPTVHQYLVNPTHWPAMADLVTWCQNMDPISGALLILGGLFFLFSGFKMHRMLIACCGVIIGAYLGAGLALRYNFPMLAGIPAGALILGVAAWYLTAWSAAAVGAVCGAFVGAAVWNMAGLAPNFAWSGALTGAVALGLLCFIIFRISVILFTSLLGSVMLVLGLLGLAYQYPFIKPKIDSSMGAYPYVLPATILGLMVLGLGYQYLKGPGGSGKPATAGASAKSSSSSKDSSAKKEK